MKSVASFLRLFLFFGSAFAQAQIGEIAIKDIQQSQILVTNKANSPAPVTGFVENPFELVLYDLGLESWISNDLLRVFETVNSLDRVFVACQCKGKTWYEENCQFISDDYELLHYDAHKKKRKDLQLLSVAEGSSDLVIRLQEEGLSNTKALDLFYDPSLKIPKIESPNEAYASVIAQWFIQKKEHKNFMILGDAADLKKVIKENSQDMIVAHSLFHLLTEDQQKRFLNESFRALKVGGTLRVDHADSLRVKKNMDEIVLKNLNKTHSQMSYSLVERNTEYRLSEESKKQINDILNRLTRSSERGLQLSDIFSNVNHFFPFLNEEDYRMLGKDFVLGFMQYFSPGNLYPRKSQNTLLIIRKD